MVEREVGRRRKKRGTLPGAAVWGRGEWEAQALHQRMQSFLSPAGESKNQKTAGVFEIRVFLRVYRSPVCRTR